MNHTMIGKTPVYKDEDCTISLIQQDFQGHVFTEEDAVPSGSYRHLDLRGATLAGLDLKDSRFRAVKANDAVFTGSDLSGSYFRGSDLRGVDFSGCNLRGVTFRGCLLKGAKFTGVDLTEVVFPNSQLDSDIVNAIGTC
jgi:uncharacterized protein YjbI with pentapeptide repeats